jgi:hypothetical protein
MDLVNIGLNTTQGRLYLITERTLEKLEIQFIPPSINIERNANYATFQIVGRNTPQYQFLGGETRLPLSLDFYADDEFRRDVELKCKWLEALCAYDGKKPAQRVKLIFGDLFKEEMWVVQSVKYTFNLFDRVYGFRPRLGKCDLVLGLDPTTNLTWADIRREEYTQYNESWGPKVFNEETQEWELK